MVEFARRPIESEHGGAAPETEEGSQKAGEDSNKLGVWHQAASIFTITNSNLKDHIIDIVEIHLVGDRETSSGGNGMGQGIYANQKQNGAIGTYNRKASMNTLNA